MGGLYGVIFQPNIVQASYYNKSKLAQILSHLRHYDLMSKGVIIPNIPEKEILKEMIFKIMH